MTPCEKLGYRVGDKFVVGPLCSTYVPGSIVTLYKDDGTDCPKFSGDGAKFNLGPNGSPGAYIQLENVSPYTEQTNSEESQMTHLTPKGYNLLKEVALWLERGAPEYKGVDEFDLDVGISFYGKRDKDTGPACETVCCIAGAVVQFNNPFEGVSYGGANFYPDYDGDPDSVLGRAQELLGIEHDNAMNLFVNFPDEVARNLIAVAVVVRHFLETGEVDWDLVSDYDEGEED